MSGDGKGQARTVSDKVMSLVHAIAGSGEPMRLATLAQVSDTSKATCRRLLLDLCHQGYVRSPARGLYAVGPRLQGLAAAVVRHDPVGGVMADSLAALARATGHVALRLGVADGHAIVLAVENPQSQPLPLAVGAELASHPIWQGEDSELMLEAYPMPATWLAAVATDQARTGFIALTGFSLLQPQDDQALQLLRAHAGALRGAMEAFGNVS